MVLLDKKEFTRLRAGNPLEFQETTYRVESIILFSSLMRNLQLCMLSGKKEALLAITEKEEYFWLTKTDTCEAKLERKLEFDGITYKREFRDFLAMAVHKEEESPQHQKSQCALYRSHEQGVAFLFQEQDQYQCWLGKTMDSNELTLYPTGPIS
jgi:hypothetical protein